MPFQTDLRKAARAILDGALRAASVREAIRDKTDLNRNVLRVFRTHIDISSRTIHVVAIGKAAPAMALGFSDVLGDRITSGLIAGPALLVGQSFDPARWEVFAAGHPLPNQESLAAARKAFEVLERASEERALLIFLVSGGGSAMIEWPCDERITLAELQQANRELVRCGASIAEINAVRRAFSAVKGGGLAARAPLADQITVIVSDTNWGDEASVASGPTLEAPANAPDPQGVLARYQLATRFPASVLSTISRNESTPRRLVAYNQPIRQHHLLLSNRNALEAAGEVARRFGFTVEIAADICEQPIAAGCKLLMARLQTLRDQSRSDEKPVCLISGGEFSCPVRGNGIGGRNTETALRCAIGLAAENDGRKTGWRHAVVLSAGTDGLDGNSPAAGAVADENTIARARARKLETSSFLDRSDAFTFFNELEDAIITGPTGTNLRDLRILLASK